MYPFRPFSVENTIVYREEFSKVKHSNYACYIVLFFSQKQAKCNHFSTEGMSTFSEISDKKSGRYTFGKNVSLRKNECFTSKNFNIPEVKHLYLRRYSFHFFCPKRLKCNHIGHFLLKIPQYIEKNFQKLNIQILLATSSSFWRKNAKCKHFFTEGMSTFSVFCLKLLKQWTSEIAETVDIPSVEKWLHLAFYR